MKQKNNFKNKKWFYNQTIRCSSCLELHYFLLKYKKFSLQLVAKTEFLEKGFRSVSLWNIVKTAGVTTGWLLWVLYMADCEVLENKTLIQTVLSRLIQNKTVLVIVHWMRNIAGADKIVVLSDGTVAKQGAPDDLYRKNEERNGFPYGESASKQSKLNHKIKKKTATGGKFLSLFFCP